jgi:tRNA pseudouridine13 synthase
MSESLAYLTADIPGCGGVFKQTPEDFVVEEIPAYEPNGAGEHLFLWIEKRGLSSQQVAEQLAVAAGAEIDLVSYAGIKDRQAVTRQYFCLPSRYEAKVANWSTEQARVLRALRHQNKLRSGHLNGNRFELVVRQVAHAEHAKAALARLEREGVPNYFGEQRFGRSDDNATLGKKLLLGERLATRPSRFQRRLYLSAFQSLLFNRALDARVKAGTLVRALAGDVLKKEETRGAFVCEQPEVDQPRVDRFEVSPAGPMFGPKMLAAKGNVADAENALLAEEGISLELFERGKDETEGTRRAYRVRLGNLRFEIEQNVLRLAFSLPSGSYATVVLRELLKADAL